MGAPHDAIADFNQAIQINPNDARTYNNRGIAKAQLSDYHAAIDDFNQAIQINPQLAKAYYNRGNAKLQIGDKEGARADFLEARRLDPKIEFPDEIEKFLKETE